MYRHHLSIAFVSVCLLLLLAPALVSRSQAQTDERCFNETPYCISGRIREFWEQNGGLPVFGFPTTPLREELIEGQSYQVQWFERNRLELHPENVRPYDVLLGRLGVDRLEQQGREWQRFTRSNARAECLYFEQTGQNICEPFLSFWRASGLEFDGQPGTSEAESLALFGMPVSPPRVEVIEGRQYTVQWFERTRFEAHPENAAPYDVLFGLLGNEIRQHLSASGQTPEPVATLPGTPTPTGTSTPDPSVSPTATETATPTSTRTPTATSEATSTPTRTASPTPTPTRTAAPPLPSPTLIPGTPLPSTLRVSQLATASQVRPGQQFAYLLSAATSQEEQRTVVLRDVIDTRLEIVSVSPANGCTLNWDYNIVTCRLEVADGQPALVTVNVQVPQDMPDGTVMTNQATLSGEGETTFSEVVRVQVRE